MLGKNPAMIPNRGNNVLTSLQQKYGQLCQQDSNAMTTTRWASELYKLEARIEVYVLVLEDLEGVLRLMEDIPHG